MANGQQLHFPLITLRMQNHYQMAMSVAATNSTNGDRADIYRNMYDYLSWQEFSCALTKINYIILILITNFKEFWVGLSADRITTWA